MPFEKGGRADKAGNRYEIKAIINELLNLINETNYSVVIEPLGEDEEGTDILVTYPNGIKEHQQCKARNGSKECWEFSDLKARNIFKTWNSQLSRDKNKQVALVSPIGCYFLIDLHERALNTSGSSRDFYDIQIQKSSKDFCKFYHNFCTEMNLDYSNNNDIIRSIDFLKRINFKHISEYEIKEILYQKIEFNFYSDKNAVYNALVTFVVDADILGKEITQSVLFHYLKNQKIELRLRDGDERIIPKINEINKEFRETYMTLREGLICRKEYKSCISAIEDEKAMIITGNAGCGKSGSIETILDYCEENNIPYIAVKLDKRIPSKNCKAWGQEMGLPDSFAHVIHYISKNEKALIILDQLDALRWTQTNSSEALSVCMELIRQVKYLNYERNKKIIIVLVCRTYDLQNDNNINSLFKKEKSSDNDWIIVNIDNFDECTVREIVGEEYNQFSSKLKKLLSTPSNLYIWQHLDKEKSYGDCLTTSNLIDTWYQQIRKKSLIIGLQEKTVIDTIACIVDVLDKNGHLYAPKKILNVEEAGLDYLISSEIIIVQNNKVGFVHQSILDYFISNRMMQKYYDGQDVVDIIGEKSKQNPGKRYQVQMFLQNLLEYNSNDFIDVGERLLNSENIRYYMKFVFYEILGQISEPDENIIQFIIDNCEHEVYGTYLLNNVIFSKKQYIAILVSHGILDRWYKDSQKKTIVFNLLQSISLKLETEEIKFIKKYAFENKNDDELFSRCFLQDVNIDTDEMFELKMMFYEHYPDFAEEVYSEIKSVLKQNEVRAIKLLAFWLKNKIKIDNKYLYDYKEKLIDLSSIDINNENFVLAELLPYIPKDNGWSITYSGWSGRHIYNRGIERACVELVKKSNIELISKSPECFWKYYKTYMGKGYHVFNEIILHGLKNLPESFSNEVINYINDDLNKNAFDYTSNSNNKLGLVKEILQVHGSKCDIEVLLKLENTICQYISPNASEVYKQRIEKNKLKQYEPVYWSFWGDLQYELLHCLPKERISKKTKDLLQVLDRKFYSNPTHYYNENERFGSVKSPISGKNIGKMQWLQIITNRKLLNLKRIIEVERGFIESSYEMYVRDFELIVKQEPQVMVKLVLEHKDKVLPAFIDSMFLGVYVSENLKEIEYKIIEDMFHSFPCDMKTHKASYFCGIIEKKNITNWSAEVMDQLRNIALNHSNPELGTPDVTNDEDKEMKSCKMLRSNALNCVRGNATRVIGHLLWDNKKLFIQFKDVIEKLAKDKNPAVCFASLYALWPSYNIDKEWASDKILSLYETDIRMVSFHNSKDMLLMLYPKYRKRVIKVIEKCFTNSDKQLIEVGGHAVCEFYIQHNEFETIMSTENLKNEDQIKAILDMAIVYLNVSNYRELAKSIILKYKNTDAKVMFYLSNIFSNKYIDLNQDEQFIQELMRSKVSRRIIQAFVHYLKENAVSVIDYADIIIEICENVLNMELETLRDQLRVEDEISKLIINLYDETANSLKVTDKQIANKCLELWDIMFERQLGSVRQISRALMER